MNNVVYKTATVMIKHIPMVKPFPINGGLGGVERVGGYMSRTYTKQGTYTWVVQSETFVPYPVEVKEAN